MKIPILICLVLSLTLVQRTAYAVDAAEEYDIKAAYLMNLGNFVTWPKEALAEAGNQFNICTLGGDPFMGALEFFLEKYPTIKEYPVVVKHFEQVQETFNCHVLFVDKTEVFNLTNITQKLKNKPILLVSDLDHFVSNGGMVQFFQRNNKIRLMLAPEALTDVGLQANANLLRVAKLVSK